jgi:hypothetical protein
MEIARETALLILRKWQEDAREVHCALVCSESIQACLVGRISTTDSDFIRITAGAHQGVSFNLRDAQELRFEDWREAPIEHAQALKKAYEASMLFWFSNCQCEVHALKTPNELLGI